MSDENLVQKTVCYKYGISDRVKIKCIEIVGSVDALMSDTGGDQYRVVYWYNGTRSAVWMYDFELEKAG